MSILTFGLHTSPTPSTGTPVDPATLTLRERILEDIVSTLLTVKATGRPIAADANVSQEVTAASSGAYSGTVPRRYRIRVVTAGASGTARVTMTDVTTDLGAEPADDGPVAQVVTSGTPFDVGTLGLQATLTFSGTLVLNDEWFVQAGLYRTTIHGITRQEDQHGHEQISGNWGTLLEPDEFARDEPVGYSTKQMICTVRMKLNVTTTPEQALEALLGDVETALLDDSTRGGLAIDTTMQTNNAYALDEVKAFSGFDLVFEVLYRHRRGDPRSQ